MEETTKTIIIGSVITLLVLGIVIFIMYIGYQNDDNSSTTNSNYSESSKKEENTNDRNENTSNETVKDESVNSSTDKEENEENTSDVTINNSEREVTVYIFKGEGCGYCEQTIEYFKTTELSKYPNLKVKALEIWNNKTNKELEKKIFEKLNLEDSNSVPFILVGNEYIKGYSTSKIETAINNAYNNDKYTDLVEDLLKNNNLSVTMEDIK